jgi:2-polyprenyl-3-methyl-5-hydroxy-6-metoxy-1,4-benzoquinol methylase
VIWRCPTCRGALQLEPDERVRCVECAAFYETVAGIPDLRVDAPSWIDCAEDREIARSIVAQFPDTGVEPLVRHIFANVRGQNEAGTALRTRQVLGAPNRLRREIRGWLDDATANAPFLDLGCGPGMLLAAAAAEGRTGIGIDVSMVWLVVAQRLIREYGGTPVLAAGFAESLPLEDGAVQAVISLDVIEHVGDQETYLREIDRVAAAGALVALSTPNRFSLAAEPHIHVWGVGWLPRAFQQRYAEWRSGRPYVFTRLLSARETRRLLARNTRFTPSFSVPTIPPEEIASASPRRALLARVYNRALDLPWAASAALMVGAFFRVVGRKAGYMSA